MFPLLLIASTLGITIQQVTRKAYNQKVKNATFIFTALSVLCSLLVFVIISGGKLNFVSEHIPYCIGFALSYSAASVATFLALSTGPLSITSLIIQYSLIIPSIYGILFLNEPTSIALFIGLILLVISLLLVNLEDKTTEKKITLKWGIYVLISFIGNGACSTVQKVQQLKFGGEGKNEFMVIALLVSVTLIAVSALIFERKDIVVKIKTCPYLYVICGVSNGLVNLFVMLLAVYPASIVFPVISASGIILTALIGILFYKERLSSKQIAGICLGIASIVFLNL